MLAKIASSAPRSLGLGQGDHVLGVGRRLQPRPARRARCAATARRRPRSVGRPRRQRRRPPRSRSARRRPRSEPSGPRPAGDGDPQPAVGQPVGRRRPRRSPPAARRRSSGTASPSPAAERAQPVEVAAHGERRAVVRPCSVSNTPSPTVSAVVERATPRPRPRSTSAPSSHTAPVTRHRPATRQLARGHRQQPAGLELGLRPLALGRRVPRDAAAGAEVQRARPRTRTCGWRR